MAGRPLLEVGQMVSLLIHLRVALAPVSVEIAVVRWTDHYGARLELVAMTDHERMKLEAYLETLGVRAGSR